MSNFDENIYEQIEQYLRGELQGEALAKFEQRKKTEPALAREIQLLREMDTLLESSPENELRKNLQHLGNQVTSDPNSSGSSWRFLFLLLPILLASAWWFSSASSVATDSQKMTPNQLIDSPIPLEEEEKDKTDFRKTVPEPKPILQGKGGGEVDIKEVEEPPAKPNTTKKKKGKSTPKKVKPKQPKLPAQVPTEVVPEEYASVPALKVLPSETMVPDEPISAAPETFASPAPPEIAQVEPNEPKENIVYEFQDMEMSMVRAPAPRPEFIPNKSLERQINNPFRNLEFELNLEKMEDEFTNRSNTDAINFRYAGTMKTGQDLSERKFKVYIFSSDPTAYQNFKPLTSIPLRLTPMDAKTSQFAVQRYLALPPGLYYVLLKDEKKRAIYRVDKFLIRGE